MKKTISINLSGMVFNIEEDAYGKLHGYFEQLKAHFGTTDYGKEVVNDIENRMAEQFAGKMSDRKSEVITLSEVDDVIRSMGTVEDLSAGETKGERTEAEQHRGQRRLYRNPDDEIIAGVASGIASYFNIDPLIPRLAFVVAVLMGGWGLLLYLILWIITPQAHSSAQKLEMRGDAVNIATLEETRKNAGNRANFSVVRYFFREVFYLFGRLLRVLGPLILTLVGLFLTAVAFAATFAITLVTLVLLFNPDSTYIDPAIRAVFNGSQYVMMISSAFVVLIVPALMGLVVGISFVRRRNLVSVATGVTMVILWLAAGLTLGVMSSSAAPQIEAAVRSIEERPQTSQEYQLSGFDSVRSQRDQHVKITYGPEPKVIAYGRETELKDANIYVQSGTLIIDYQDGFNLCLICIKRPVTVEIITPNLASVDANNLSNIEIRGFNNMKTFRTIANNSSRVLLEGKVEQLDLDVRNVARVTLNGTANRLVANVTNAGQLDAKGMTVNDAEVEASNSSRVEITATKRITATATGASRIDYWGHPAEEIIDESNAGRVNEQ
jgi:phage shock protein PspC (stress-responsive transcriptional regulator)